MSQYLPVIAIDGPVGVGKSTIAMEVAGALDFYYLDTGAMYRAFALKCLRKGISCSKLADDNHSIFSQTVIDIQYFNKTLTITLDGEDVTGIIRCPEVSDLSSKVSSYKSVRDYLISQQRRIGMNQPSVVEGRDIGTVVFPDAFLKIYLDADFSERVRRRYQQYKESGVQISKEELRKSIQVRDEEDLNRPFGALKKADDAFYVDSTTLTPVQVVQEILKLYEQQKCLISA